jgi:hypothetical protein
MKTKEEILREIFENDPLDLLNIKPQKSAIRTSDERLAASFDEINAFFEKNEREPKPDPTTISEYKLYSTLKGLRENNEKMLALEPQDKHGLLNTKKKEIKSLDDIFGDDFLDILGDDSEGLFTFNHTPTDVERAKADFVARRKKCKDFDKYESTFKEVQDDLALGKRKLVDFNYESLSKGNFYVNNGILLFLKDVDFSETFKSFKSGLRNIPDGRTVTIFENGTESNMMFQSLYKALHANGKMVTQSSEQVNEELMTNFGNTTITEEDKAAGYIYVLKSKSEKEEITSIENLYKIGYSSTKVEDRIKNAKNEPTYLMASVEIESSWQCYNMNPQKFEKLIHQFFGSSCLAVDVFDTKGIRHSPREWFIVPLQRIEEAIMMIISERIINYRYDRENETIIEK